MHHHQPLPTPLFILALVVFAACGDGPPRELKPVPRPVEVENNCRFPFFELIADLEGCDTVTDPFDLTHDTMLLVVGEASYNDPNDPDDCTSDGHHGAAFGWTRPCSKQSFMRPDEGAVGGRTGGTDFLGYHCPGPKKESFARGISPDGRLAIGFCQTASLPLALAWDRHGKRTELSPFLSGHIASVANDASGRFLGQLDPPQQLGSPLHYQMVVGYSSTGHQHASTASGARAVAWGPWYGDQRELPVNPNIGVRTWESSEAVTVSDDGMVIGGNIYYTLPGSGFLSLPCIWQWSVTDGDYLMTLLEDLQGGKRHAKVHHLSGDGKVAVGMADGANGLRAVVWLKSGDTWMPAQDLGLLGDFTNSTALGTDAMGTTIVGSSGTFNETTFEFTQRAVLWERKRNPDNTWGPFSPPQDVMNLLQAAGLAKEVGADWQHQAKRISMQERYIIGDSHHNGIRQAWVAQLP